MLDLQASVMAVLHSVIAMLIAELAPNSKLVERLML